MTIQLPFTAGPGELLAALRPYVETILQKYQDGNDDIPACQSQSHRANKVVDYINRQLKEAIFPDLNVRMAMIKDRGRLELFLAVHTTVVTLEWVERNESFEF